MAAIEVGHHTGWNALDAAGMGTLDYTEGEIYDDITFTPVGKYSLKSILHSHAASAIGTSLFGADAPLILWTQGGIKRTYKAAAIITPPRLTLNPRTGIWGPVTFRCIRGESAAATDDDALYTEEDAGYPGDAGIVANDLPRQAYQVAWQADSPLESFVATEGVSVNVSLSAAAVNNDQLGLADMTLTNQVVEVTLTPYGLNPADVLAFMHRQGAGAGPGRRAGASGTDLVITGTGVTITVPGAVLTDSASTYGGGVQNQKGITFKGTRSHAAGALRPWYVLG